MLVRTALRISCGPSASMYSNCQNGPWRGGMSWDWPPNGAMILPESMMVGPTNQPASMARRTSLMAHSALLPTSRNVVKP